MSEITSTNFVQQFLTFEENPEVRTIQVKGFLLWDYLRRSVYYAALQFKPDYFKKSREKWKSWFIEIPHIVLYLLRTLFERRQKYDILFVNYNRRGMVDGKLANIHTYPFIKALSQHYKVLLIDPAERHISVEEVYPCKVIRLRPYKLLYRLKTAFIRFSQHEKKLFLKLESLIHQELKLPIKMGPLVRGGFSAQLINVAMYRYFFKKYRPRICLFCDNGNEKGLIEAAHECGVTTVDLQHSLISKNNILYNYSDKCIDAFQNTNVDYVFSFGDFWNDKCNMPSVPLSVGFPFLEESRRSLRDKIAPNKSIIIVSGSYSKQTFIRIALDLCEKLPDWTIYYKLRIEDYEGWRDRYPPEFQSTPNLVVIDNHEMSLYEYYCRCSYQIGVNSTGLCEGMAFQLGTFILNTGWYEEMREFYENDYVFLVSSAEEIATKVIAGARPKNSHLIDHLFKGNSLNNIQVAVATLMANSGKV